MALVAAVCVHARPGPPRSLLVAVVKVFAGGRQCPAIFTLNKYFCQINLQIHFWGRDIVRKWPRAPAGTPGWGCHRGISPPNDTNLVQ